MIFYWLAKRRSICTSLGFRNLCTGDGIGACEGASEYEKLKILGAQRKLLKETYRILVQR